MKKKKFDWKSRKKVNFIKIKIINKFVFFEKKKTFRNDRNMTKLRASELKAPFGREREREGVCCCWGWKSGIVSSVAKRDERERERIRSYTSIAESWRRHVVLAIAINTRRAACNSIVYTAPRARRERERERVKRVQSYARVFGGHRPPMPATHNCCCTMALASSTSLQLPHIAPRVEKLHSSSNFQITALPFFTVPAPTPRISRVGYFAFSLLLCIYIYVHRPARPFGPFMCLAESDSILEIFICNMGVYIAPLLGERLIFKLNNL